MKVLRAWVADFPKSDGRPSGMVTISMRFAAGDHTPTADVMELRRNREDPTLEQHVRFGLLDVDSLPIIRDAIDKYLEDRGH